MGTSVKKTGKDSWDRTVVSVARLPKSWKAQVLVDYDKTVSTQPMTQALLDKVDAKNPRDVDRIFQVVTNTSSNTPVPMKCRILDGIRAVRF